MTDPKTISLRYVLSLAIIAALLGGLHLLSRYSLETSRVQALHVAESNGQELRLHRLTDAAKAFVANPTQSTRGRLGEALAQFERGHADLLAMARENRALSALYFGPRGIVQASREVTSGARSLLAGAPDPDRMLARQQMSDHSALETLLLRGAAVALQASERHMNAMQRTDTLLLFAVIIAVILQAALIFWPTMRSMRRALDLLRRRGASLSRARRSAVARAVALRDQARRFEEEARRDALTGLANRRGFNEAVQGRLDATPGQIAVLHIDLDRFRQLNETAGQVAGDAMLRHAADVLRQNAGPEAVVARMGGDEFAVMTDACKDREALSALAGRLIGALSAPMVAEGQVCRVGASIGLAFATDWDRPDAADAGPNIPAGDKPCAAQLLGDAALALDDARKAGGMHCAFYTPDLRVKAQRVKRLSDDLLAGLPRGEIIAHYQPQFCARTLGIIGAEALARWRHPEFGLLQPYEFLPIADDLGVLGDVDHAMLACALRDRLEWQAEGVHVERVSVNVSTRRLQDPGLVESLRSLNVPRGAIAFELLESSFLDVRSGAMDWNIDTLGEMGIDIEIDDFGTGHASIASVMAVRPRRLKIARELIQPIVDNPRQRDVVRALVGISRTLGAEVTAEGVETMAHVEATQALGVDLLQGYALARPMPKEAIVAFAREGAWRRTA